MIELHEGYPTVSKSRRLDDSTICSRFGIDDSNSTDRKLSLESVLPQHRRWLYSILLLVKDYTTGLRLTIGLMVVNLSVGT